MGSEITNHLDDYKLSSFFNNILIDNTISKIAFGDQILNAISEVFGFDKSTFWLLNPDINSYIPIAYRIGSHIINAYLNQFYKIDPFYPDNFLNRKSSEDVVSISDIMTYEEYYISPYYTKFLEPENICYQTVLYLRSNGAIIGGIALLKSKEEGDFSQYDINMMKKAVTYITKLTSNYLSDNEIKLKQDLYESLCNQSPIGIIAFNAYHPYKIKYMNSSVVRYVSDILGEKSINHLTEHFIEQHIANTNFFQFGLHKTLVSQSSKKYDLSVIPCQANDTNNLLVHAYVVPQSNISESQNTQQMPDYNGLSARQKEIVKYVLQGCSNEEISRKLFISTNTVKAHLNKIFKELNVTSRLSLCSKFIENKEKL